MLHHLSFAVKNIELSGRFYDAVLDPLGYRRVCVAKDFIGYGIEDGKDKFALMSKGSSLSTPSPGFHLAFSAPDQGAVDGFYRAAIENGGIDNGQPGLRPQYGPDYYAAYIIDPDGYHIEALFKA